VSAVPAPDMDADSAELFSRVFDAHLVVLTENTRLDPKHGRRLPSLLEETKLVHWVPKGRRQCGRAARPAENCATHLRQLREPMLAPGRVSATDIDQACDLCCHGLSFVSPLSPWPPGDRGLCRLRSRVAYRHLLPSCNLTIPAASSARGAATRTPAASRLTTGYRALVVGLSNSRAVLVRPKVRRQGGGQRRSCEELVQDCRRLKVAVQKIVDLPLASLVEVDRWPSCRDPQLLVTLVACPSLKVPKQQPS
jgi:hypothetical protein